MHILPVCSRGLWHLISLSYETIRVWKEKQKCTIGFATGTWKDLHKIIGLFCPKMNITNILSIFKCSLITHSNKKRKDNHTYQGGDSMGIHISFFAYFTFMTGIFCNHHPHEYASFNEKKKNQIDPVFLLISINKHFVGAG